MYNYTLNKLVWTLNANLIALDISPTTNKEITAHSAALFTQGAKSIAEGANFTARGVSS